MKKIFNFVVLALAVSLAFTGCASKKAKDANGSKTYRVDLGSVVSTIEIGKEAQAFNVTSLLPEGAVIKAGDKVRVLWTASADADIGTIYVSFGELSDDFELIENVTAGKTFYAAQSVPLDLDVTGPLYVSIWSDTKALCESAEIDAK